MRYSFLVLSLLLVASSCQEERSSESNSSDQGPKTLLDSIAYAHGYAAWKEVKKVDFTFYVDVNDTLRTKRDWTWFTKTDSIRLIEDADTMHYVRAPEVDSAMQRVDSKFINDTYWLFMPYYLLWSEGFSHTVAYNVTSPLDSIPTTMLTVQYDTVGGYTPGDAYDLYINDAYQLVEWAFRKGGQAQANLVTTWSDYREIEGLLLPTEHRMERPVKLYHPYLEVVTRLD